jgi:hypothetical protein
MFLTSCFELANDSEAPESLLSWSGFRRLLAPLAHRRWHYVRDGQPSRYVRWYARSGEAPAMETLLNLGRSFAAWLTGGKPHWVLEAEAAAAAAAQTDVGLSRAAQHSHAAAATHANARAVMRHKRLYAAAGVLGTLLMWAVFTW